MDWWSHYCMRCGAPVGAYTLFLPYEHSRAYGEFLVRSARAALKGNGFSWITRVLGLSIVLLFVPYLFLVLPFGHLWRRDGERA